VRPDAGSSRRAARRGAAICLEPQHSPDSPHHADWPGTVLRPGAVYRSCSVYRFGVTPDITAGTA
jgi:aldose 1-epimerase